MDTNGFAALLASVIESERRIGRVPLFNWKKKEGRLFQWGENILAWAGCTTSGHSLSKSESVGQFWNRLTNQDVPQRVTVGIGNVWLNTAANLWKGQACSSTGECTPVEASKLQTTNAFGWTVDITNPFDPQTLCTEMGCGTYELTETGSYQKLALQLLNDKMNIEYVAANLEAGALRISSIGFGPTAFNLATWHLKGLQTNREIEDSGWNPGAAIYILLNFS